MPEFVGIESTNRCNLRCVHCHQSQFKMLHGDFDPSQFQSLISELDSSTTICLSCMGEPLVAKDFKVFFEYVVNKGYRTEFITNGHLLDAHMEAMIGRNVGITLSMDGASADVYRSVRGVSNQRVIDNIMNLRRLKEKYATEDPTLSITMVLSRRNIEDLPEMVLLAHKAGAERLVAYHQVFYMNNVHNEFNRYSLFFHKQLSDEMHMKAINLAQELGIAFFHTPLFLAQIPVGEQKLLSSYISTDKKYCKWFKKHALVGWHGVVLGCDTFDRFFMGSLKHNSFRDIWNGPLYREVRLKFINGDPPDICSSNCVAMQTVDNTKESFFRVLVDEKKLQTPDLAGPLSYSFGAVNSDYRRAVELSENGRDDMAMEILLQLLKIDNNFFEVHHLIALIHKRNGRDDMAGTFFTRAEAVCRNYANMM